MKDSTNEMKPYEAPQLTVVSFKVERGFTASNGLTGTNSVILGEWLLSNNNSGNYADRNGYGTAATGDDYNWF